MSAGCVSTFRTCVQVYLEIYVLFSCFSPSFHVIWLISCSFNYRWLSPLQSRSIYKMLHFAWRSVSAILCNRGEGGEGVEVYLLTRSRTDAQSLTSCSSSMWSKKIMESSEDIFSYRNRWTLVNASNGAVEICLLFQLKHCNFHPLPSQHF